MDIALKFIGLVVVIFGFALLLTLPVMWLWNATMPELFGLHEIGFWMAVKISLLSSCLFKGGSK